MSLSGSLALITGAGSGIGRALAIEAARRGAGVALVGRRAERLKETRLCLVNGAECLIVPGDVTSRGDRRAIRDMIAKQWGSLDILVNNAGIVTGGPLGEIRDSELERLMVTNVMAPIAVTRDMLPLLLKGAPSRVVNVGSMLGDIGCPMFTAYTASKFALRGLSSALRRELKSFDIGVTYAAPRGARTDATKAIAPLIETLKMPLDDTGVIARRIWDAVERGRNTAYPPGRERAFLFLERLFPAVVDRALTTQLEASGLRRLVEDSLRLSPSQETFHAAEIE